MCTVSFYKNKTEIIITSNRDEHHSRAKALPPQVYKTENYQLIYCKDAQANGTWMVLRNDGTTIVLLNGAFERHQLNPPYRKSRGLVLLDIINEENCLQKYKEYDLANIEPFTIVIYHNNILHECIWNGNEKFIAEKSTEENYIWSSVTLYDEEFRNKKRDLFQQLLQTKLELKANDILKFHHSKQDLDNGFIINRNQQLLTFSVTQIILSEIENTFLHHDLLDDKSYMITANEFSKKSFL
ncbi:MAG TPA: NRDE family protein [Chitinophagales bacterium]|nr:NRDE family protein [Chitinophagales bacterium]